MADSASTPTPRIAELNQFVGQTVTVRGWVTHVRSSGKVAFVVMRDGTGIVQAVFVKTQLPPEVWERFEELTLETSRARDRRGACRAARAGRLRARASRVSRSSARARSTIRSSRRSTASIFCSTTGTSGCAAPRQARDLRDPQRDRAGDPRLLLRARIPPRRHADSHGGDRRAQRAVRDRVLRRRQRRTSRRPASCTAKPRLRRSGKIYTFGPTFRAEKSKTRRHLTEFWMIEPEVAFDDSADNMRLQEDFVSSSCSACSSGAARSSRSSSATRQSSKR